MIDKLITEFLLQAIIDNRTVILVTCIVILKECLEYWLGKTDKVQAGSSLELILLFIKKIKNVFKS